MDKEKLFSKFATIIKPIDPVDEERRQQREEEIRKLVTNDIGEIDSKLVANLVGQCLRELARRGNIRDVYELPKDHPVRVAHEERIRIRMRLSHQ